MNIDDFYNSLREQDREPTRDVVCNFLNSGLDVFVHEPSVPSFHFQPLELLNPQGYITPEKKDNKKDFYEALTILKSYGAVAVRPQKTSNFIKRYHGLRKLVDLEYDGTRFTILYTEENLRIKKGYLSLEEKEEFTFEDLDDSVTLG